MDATNQGAMAYFVPVGRPAEPHLHVLTTTAGHQVTATSTGFGTMRPQFTEPRPPTVQLYLCDSGSDGGRGVEEKVREKVSSMNLLQQCYQTLTDKKIKDNLSSFLPEVPGEFDTADTPDSMLRTLIDRPPIGGRDFLPLSEQSLLGFRLHPGALPEQYRLDPFSGDTHHHHHHKKKKKKHKHKHIDRDDSTALDNYSPPSTHPHSPPVDPCSFIKAEQTANFFRPHTEHHPTISLPHHTLTHINPVQVANFPQAHTLVTSHPGLLTTTQQPGVIRGAPMITAVPQLAGVSGQVLSVEQARQEKKRKKRHQDPVGEGGLAKKKKKKDKDKKKKKEKHHGVMQDTPSIPQSVIGGGPPPLISASYQPPPSLSQPPAVQRPPQHM